MKNLIMMAPMKGLLFAMSVLLLQACGGSGGGGDVSDSGGLSFSGNSAPAEISSENAQEIGETAGESIQQAAASNGAPVPVAVELQESDTFFGSDLDVALTDLNNAVVQGVELSGLPVGPTIDASDACTAGGSATYTSSNTNTTGPISATIRYSNCSIRSGNTTFTITGTVEIRYDDVGNASAGYYFRYRNVTVSSPSFGTQTLNFTLSCRVGNDPDSCSYLSDFTGADGNTHRVSNFNVSGSASLGFNGSATFTHYSHGEVSIVFNGITYGNCGSQPDGGSITFTSSTSTSGTITFNSNCTVNGTWTTSTGSGSF